MDPFYLSTLVYLFSSLISVIALMLLYLLFTFLLAKDIYWLIRCKPAKAILPVVSGVIIMVVIEQWLERVLPALLNKV